MPFKATGAIADSGLTIVATSDGSKLTSVTMPTPSDFHNHFRVGELRLAITPEVSWPYKYVLAMPNTDPHIYTLADAEQYRGEVMGILADAGITSTQIVMTIYLAHSTTPEMIVELAACGLPIAVKAYPPGATTNSDEAAPILEKIDVLKSMEKHGVRLLIHGESTHDADGNEIDFPDREDYFYNHVYPEVRRTCPDLLICLEHITTRTAVEIVKADTSGNTVCTITPQHAFMDNSAFDETWGGNHARCMPYLKGPEDVRAIREFMTSGDSRAILGTDCAPHVSAAKDKPFKEAACGCYTPHALAMYTGVFWEEDALDDRFVRFACTNGPDWWDLERPHTDNTIMLRVVENGVPDPTLVLEIDEIVIPLGWTEDPKDRMPLEIEAVRK